MVAGQTISRHINEIARRWKYEGETEENAKIWFNFFWSDNETLFPEFSKRYGTRCYLHN